MILVQFRQFVQQLADYRPVYCPIFTEVKGMTNIASGVAQIVVGNCMKFSQQPRYRNIQSQRHITRGTSALTVGMKQFLPGAVVASGGFYLLKYEWEVL